MAGSDTTPLLQTTEAKQSIQLLGFELSRRVRSWHFALVFPIFTPEQGKAEIKDPEATWKTLFLVADDTALPTFPKTLTLKDLVDMAWSKVWDLLEGSGYEIQQFESIDGDETFVLFKAKDIDEVAEFAEARARLKPETYHKAMKKEGTCPTETRNASGDWHLEVYTDGLVPGEKITNEFPHYVRYTRAIADKVEPFTVPEQLRLTRRHLRSLFSIVEMEKLGVISKFFPLHEWEKLDRLFNRGWSNPGPAALAEWPTEHVSDVVAQYTGSRIAFFFHFYDVFTRWMCVPGLLGLCVLIYSFIFPGVDKTEKVVKSIYGCLICIWATVFLARHEQLMNMKKVRWGLSGAVSEVANVRRQFSDAYRGTVQEGLQNLGHWILVFLVLGQFVWVLFTLNGLRHVAHENPDGKTFEFIPNEYVIIGTKYLITINIKVVDFGWTLLSTWLSKKENHRAEMDLKSAMAVKLFAVKFVIFYYPFARLLLIQPYLEEGCPKAGCVEVLRADLRVFFITQVASLVVENIVALALLKWSMRTEIMNKEQRQRTAESSGSARAFHLQGQAAPDKLSYIEVQAMLSEYDETEEITQYMQVVTNFGFVTMFGCLCPSVSLLCFLANFPIKKLTAFKFAYALRRVMPMTQDGIGSWAAIMHFVGFIGITMTTYSVVFHYDTFEGSSMLMKLIAFVLIERGLIALKIAVEGFLGNKTVVQKRVEEYNESVIDKVIPRIASQKRNSDGANQSKKPARRSIRQGQP